MPILDNLEKKFSANETPKESLKQRTKNAIDDCLQTSLGNMRNLVAALQQKQIYTVLRQNAEGRLYGITFVDNQNKVVFNGSDLGKGYSAAALQSRLATGNEKSLTQEETKSSSSASAIQKEMGQQKHQEKQSRQLSKVKAYSIYFYPAKSNMITPHRACSKRKERKKERIMIYNT